MDIRDMKDGARDDVGAILNRAGAAGKIVFVSGFFNILHPGHLRLLRFAAECGDFLVVGVNPDGDGDAFIGEQLRLEGVNAINIVDHAFILDESPAAFISRLKPAVVVKGKEHETGWNPEAEVVSHYGGKMFFASGDMSFSLVELLQKEHSDHCTILGDLDYMARHQFDAPCLRGVLDRFSALRVAVLGEIIVDEYITCDALGMSREEPSLVVSPVGRDLFLGGAGIVAAHASSLGARVSFFSIVGRDAMADFAREHLSKGRVDANLFVDESRPTILKQRFRSAGKTLLRVNHLRRHPIDRELQGCMVDRFMEMLPELDLVIFSDFNYGGLPQPLVDILVKSCKEYGVRMVADSQSSSQVGDVSRFKDMVLLTPTEREARLALKDFESGLVVLAEKLRRISRAQNVFITLDKEGLLVHADHSGGSGYLTDRLSAMNPMAKDPAGAGDSLLTCSALSLAVGGDIWQSAYIGSVAAACQVGKKGNIPLSAADMGAAL